MARNIRTLKRLARELGVVVGDDGGAITISAPHGYVFGDLHWQDEPYGDEYPSRATAMEYAIEALDSLTACDDEDCEHCNDWRSVEDCNRDDCIACERFYERVDDALSPEQEQVIEDTLEAENERLTAENKRINEENEGLRARIVELETMLAMERQLSRQAMRGRDVGALRGF